MPVFKAMLLSLLPVLLVVSVLSANQEFSPETSQLLHGAVPEKADERPLGMMGNVLIDGAVLSLTTKYDPTLSSVVRQGNQSDDAKLKQLSPSVLCGDDSMTLNVSSSRTPKFMVGQDGSLVPISDVPASCGYSVKRMRRDVSLVAPYRGCHVRQQGGSYVLPLVIKGLPVTVSCPVNPPLPMVSCLSTGMAVSLEVRADAVKIKVAGLWQPLVLARSLCGFTLETDDSVLLTAPFTGSCWEITDTDRRLSLRYGDRGVTVSCPLPTTPAPTTPSATVPADIPFPPGYFPYPYWKPWWFYQATAPPTTTTTPAPQAPMFPAGYPVPFFNPYYYYQNQQVNLGGYGQRWQSKVPFPWYQNLVAPATTAAPTTSPPVQYPSYQWYQMLYGPQAVKYFPYNYFQASATTPAPTTTAAPAQYPGFPPYPLVYGPQFSKTYYPVKYPSRPQYVKSPFAQPPRFSSLQLLPMGFNFKATYKNKK